MRVRHRIPSIFTLSMVDVLCCALGCVILLWLLNLRQAKEHEDSAGESTRRSAAMLVDAESERDGAYYLLTEMEARIQELERDGSRVRGQLAFQASTARELEDKLTASSRRLVAMERDAAAAAARVKELKTLADTVPNLEADLKAAKTRYASEEALAKALEQEIAKRTQELADAAKAMQVLQTSRQSLERDLTAARALKDKMSATEERAATLSKLLDERGQLLASAKKQLEMLEEDRKALRAEAARFREAADNRFAGIQLTGERVVFLVDMSGSMELVDENTPAPLKWSEVRETVAKVMRSLPGLRKYQVIVFSDKVAFPLASDGAWLDYDAKTSPDKVLAALAAIKPKGATDMYAALDAAFRFRAQDLDTIYLMSDGLPNVGEGLKPEDRSLEEVKRSDILAKYIRKKLKTDWNFPGPGGKRVRINAVGFFYESPDVGAFLWALARENDGSFVGMSRP